MKSFLRLVATVVLLDVGLTLLMTGGSADSSFTFGSVFLLIAMFAGLPLIVVITLYRYVEKRDHG
jgi:hypothetical protein